MATLQTVQKRQNTPAQYGFSLIELLIAVTILLAVSGIVMTAMVQMTKSQASINNRTDMHSSVRSVTSLLQQEISQAGRVTLPFVQPCDQAGQPPCGTTTLGTAVVLVDPITPTPEVRTVTVGSTAGMFDNILLLITSGGTCAFCEDEVVEATIGAGGQITATFRKNHGVGARIWPNGGFVTGILTTVNGNVLRMYGDINDDGNIVFVEYSCNPNAAGDGTLTRSQTPWNAAAINNPPQVLLNNLLINPPDAITGLPVPCFAYQTKPAAWTALDGVTARNANAVVNVAVTLTARTSLQQRPIDDPATPIDERYDYETKALLTVSPRNAFQAQQMSTIPGSAGQQVQITPSSIAGGPLCCIGFLNTLP